MNFFSELKRRNALSFWFGLFNLAVALGGTMLGLLKHIVGGPGIHSLQVLPLFGNYFAKTKKQTIIFSVVYFLFASALFLQAMKGIPLFF